MRTVQAVGMCLGLAAASGCMIIAVDVDELNGGSRKSGKLAEKFEGIKRIEIETVSGDCKVTALDGDSVEAEVEFDVRPAKAMNPVFRRDGELLILKEEWGKHGGQGDVRWTLAVPPSVEIAFKTCSGDFRASGLVGKVTAHTASGDLDVSRLSGDAVLETASGDIDVRDCTGSVLTSTSSGRISKS